MEPSPESVLLTGRRALVTGAARGIGEATALALARFGADIAVCDRLGDGLEGTVEGIRRLGREAHSAVLDVRDTEAVGEWVEGLNRDWGDLHVLVNNAGGGFVAEVEDLTPRGQAALIAENFSQVADVTRVCLPMLVRGAADTAGGASIVNITSIEAHRAGPGFGIYSAMKAGVANLTKTLALELATRRVRVNAIAPDMIPTPGDAALTEDSGALAQSGAGWAPTPWPEEGHPGDVAAAVLWLASPMSRFVTGTTIHVDGGTFAASGWKRPIDGGAWAL